MTLFVNDLSQRCLTASLESIQTELHSDRRTYGRFALVFYLVKKLYETTLSRKHPRLNNHLYKASL